MIRCLSLLLLRCQLFPIEMTDQPARESLEHFLRTILGSLPTPPPPYCLVGALALGAWGRIRSTKDIDLLMLAEESQRTRLVNSLNEKGFKVDQNWLDQNPLAADRVNRFLHPSFQSISLDILFVADKQEEETL